MRKFIKYLLIIFSFVFAQKVYGITFYEGSYIQGDYITSVNERQQNYRTSRFLKDEKNNIVYCLQQFNGFAGGAVFTKYDDLSLYNELSDEQKLKISLIAYYGYGYENHTESKWYSVTQLLIWTISEPQYTLYFTDTLNGKRINKYDSEIEEIMTLVNNSLNFNMQDKSLNIDYDGNITENNIPYDYSIVSSSYDNYSFKEGTLNINNIKQNGKIVFNKVNNYYSNNATIYDVDNYQDLIRPGNVTFPNITYNVNIVSGKLLFTITPDKSIYSIESTLNNTCYELLSNDKVIDNICFDDNKLSYETSNLPLGEYVIRQKSNGEGYRQDIEEYRVELTSTNGYIKVDFFPKLIRNTISIKKYACKENLCFDEEDAEFVIKNKNDEIVKSIKTNEKGIASLELGYGKYSVTQLKGLTDYSFISPYQEHILDETTLHEKILYNHYQEKKTEIITPSPTPIPDEEPPDTGIQVKNSAFCVVSIITAICVIIGILKIRTS